MSASHIQIVKAGLAFKAFQGRMYLYWFSISPRAYICPVIQLLSVFIDTIFKKKKFQSYPDKNDMSSTFGTSFPKEYQYGGDSNEPDSQSMVASQKPRILLMGLRRYIHLYKA